MSNNRISYLNKTFDDYKQSLREYVAEHYPQIANDFDDASVGSWLIDMVSAVGDNLSFYIDKAYSETNIETAQQPSSIYNIARSNGFKVPGPKGSMAEVEFSCVVPVTGEEDNSTSSLGMPNMDYAPVIKKGTKVMSRNQVFEVMNDIDFSEQFDYNGFSNRKIVPQYENKVVTGYKITKTDVVVAGESKVYRQVISSKDVVPFMEVIIPDTNVMNIESIIFKDGSNFQSDPTIGEFMNNNEYVSTSESPVGVETFRFFEVDSLVEQYRWGDSMSKRGNQIYPMPQVYTYGYWDEQKMIDVPVSTVVKGEWIPLTQKFITEFTDNGYLKITFGGGESVGEDIPQDAQTFSKYQMSKIVKNNFLGKLPKAGWTMYILYRVGGGAKSNVAKGTINSIPYLNVDIGKSSTYCDNREKIANVKKSISVINTTPSVSGKDAPTVEELKAMIKYNNAAQERCVTVKDYENRIIMMPPRYGCPFRVCATEENNKIMIYLLGLDYNGNLNNTFPEQMLYNITNYLSMYKTVNDYVEIKAGEVINLSFEADVFIDKNYNSGDVILNVINTIKDYMDINKHHIGEDIFVGDIEKNISDIDGVLNLIDLRIYNVYGGKYSNSRIGQIIDSSDSSEGRDRVDIDKSSYVLNSNNDSMFEIRHPDVDIKVRVMTR